MIIGRLIDTKGRIFHINESTLVLIGGGMYGLNELELTKVEKELIQKKLEPVLTFLEQLEKERKS